MATNYAKYFGSTGTHYISNSGSDENGGLHGGKAGDQTGKEWRLRSWYKRPWTCVLRHPDPAVREMIAQMGVDAALNNLIGYDQYQRYTYWDALVAANYNPADVKTACEADCTAGVTANVKATGHRMNLPALENIAKDTRSSNMRSRFKAAGFQVLTDAKYLTGYNYLLPGDILLYDNHHAATNITKGKYAVEPSTSAPVSSVSLGDRILKNGMAGDDVKELQNVMILLGYSCGSYGPDGDFGDCTEMAVRKFQREHSCDVDGEVGPQTLTALRAAQSADPAAPQTVKIIGGDCYVRDAPDKETGKKLGVAFEGSAWPYCGETSENGWAKIDFNGDVGWVSGLYGRVA